MNNTALIVQADNGKPIETTGTDPAKDQAVGDPSNSWTTMFIMFALMFALFYFLMIRPQKKEQQKRQHLIDNLKKNDRVLTSSGIIGVVQKIKDNEVVVKIDEQNNTKMRVIKSAIVNVIVDKDDVEKTEAK